MINAQVLRVQARTPCGYLIQLCDRRLPGTRMPNQHHPLPKSHPNVQSYMADISIKQLIQIGESIDWLADPLAQQSSRPGVGLHNRRGERVGRLRIARPRGQQQSFGQIGQFRQAKIS